MSTKGLAECTNCKVIAENALASNKRPRPIGYLVPDILFNQQTEDISLENKGWDLDLDTQVDLFVIAGTTLKTQGTLKLVKAMSQNVRHHGGAVIYVDRGEPSKKFSSFVDVHFRMDVDVFSEYFDKYPAKGLVQSPARLRDQLIKMVEELSADTPSRPTLPLTDTTLGDVQAGQRKPKCPQNIKFILLHTRRNGMEADAYGQAALQGIHRKGYQVELIQQCIGSFDHIPVVKTRMICPQAGELSVKIIILGHYDAFVHLTLAQRLEHEMRK
ncbi:hypothetical protein FRC11_012894 [Ceratobasidium sp. 423]|nr:hypothetical protein FRC11_012894 [Ceratobasidium sp. 423]